MTNFLKYSTPAERVGGLSISEIGGVFTGSNNIIHTLEGNEFNSDEISIVMEFNPAFNWDETVSRFIYDFSTNPSASYYNFVHFLDTNLYIRMGNTLIAVIPSIDYRDYWRQDQRNVVVIYGKSGNISAKLNDNLILDSDASVWTSVKPVDLFLGSRYDNTAYYDGSISMLKVFKRILTDKEITDIQNNTTYNYKNEALIHYPMTPATHSGTQTLDVSGNGLHGTLVDTPTQNTNKGYTFNGTSQYITFTPQTFAGEFSLAAFTRPNVTTGVTLFGHNSDTNKVSLDSGNIFVRAISSTDSTVLAPGTIVNFIGLTRDADDKIDLYANNTKYRLFSDAAQAGDTVWNRLGVDEVPNYLNGSFLEGRLFNTCLTPTQMFDMSIERIGMRE